MTCFDFNCTEQNGKLGKIAINKHCKVINLNITTPGQEITSLNGNDAVSDCEGLNIFLQTVHYLPKGLGRFFPKLKTLVVEASNLKSLEKDDLKNIPSLIALYLNKNDLESLDGDLFKFNPTLHYISFQNNKLENVGEKLLQGLTNLSTAHFGNNSCINEIANSDEEIPELVKKLQTQCPSTEEMKKKFYCSDEVAILKAENKKLKSELERFRSLETSKNRQKRNIYQQDLIVTVDDHKLTAFNLQIDSVGSTIKAVKNENGFKISTKATELLIDQQKTLLLPRNLGRHLPSLELFAVTSSSLYEVDSSVFENMENLRTLNMSDNKLTKILPETFTSLRTFRTLDLSQNFIETLRMYAFKGLSNLQNLHLNNNRLSFISGYLLFPFKDLQIADFSNNICIDMDHPTTTLREIEAKIIEHCVIPVELDCFYEIDELAPQDRTCNVESVSIVFPKTRISKLKNDIGTDATILHISEQQVLFMPFELAKIFPKLHTINVLDSKLSALLKHDLKGLHRLTTITITHNNILLIENEVFNEVPQVEHINLSNNQIQSLPTRIFSKLSQLSSLILTGNHLTTLNSDILPRKNAIENFYVNNNKIKQIDSNILRVLKAAKFIDFKENSCIDMSYERRGIGSSLSEMLFRIESKCSEN